MRGYDKFRLGHQLLFDMQLRLGNGASVGDWAKPERMILANPGSPPGWVQLPSGVNVLQFTPNDYMDCAAGDTLNLDFTTGDYSISCWTYRNHSPLSEIIVGKYWVDFDGHEHYFGPNGGGMVVETRHHHGSLGTPRTSCYSEGWLTGTWNLVGIVRRGTSVQHYRDGEALEMTCSAGGVQDPDSAAARDLVVGVRCSKNANYFNGSLKGLRIWGRALSAHEMRLLFSMERHWFGV